MDFGDIYEDHIGDIRVIALSQRVPGLDYDDVVSEMCVCLWKAWKTWDASKGKFGPYWWSLWLNRRTDITAAAGRKKRPQTALVPEPRGGSYVMSAWPEPPQGADHTAKMVWHLLASGEPVKEVIASTGMSRRRYYDLIQSWRNPDVWEYLMP